MTRLLAVDYGKSRIGLALSEGELVLALDAIGSDSNSISNIVKLIAERSVSKVLVGLPLSLSGQNTPSTQAAISFARDLSQACSRDVRLVDERLTTVSAQSKLRESGRNTRESKALIDSESAAEILRLAIAQIRLGREPGIGLHEVEL